MAFIKRTAVTAVLLLAPVPANASYLVYERIVSADVKAHQLDCLLPWTWKPQQAGRQTVQAA
jgi:hypothetical protein